MLEKLILKLFYYNEVTFEQARELKEGCKGDRKDDWFYKPTIVITRYRKRWLKSNMERLPVDELHIEGELCSTGINSLIQPKKYFFRVENFHSTRLTHIRFNGLSNTLIEIEQNGWRVKLDKLECIANVNPINFDEIIKKQNQ